MNNAEPIPCDLAELRRAAAEAWRPACEVVGLLNPYTLVIEPCGELRASMAFLGIPAAPQIVARAVEELACSLEDRGYDVERDGDRRRVLGWARAPGASSARYVDLDPWDRRLAARRARLIRERAARHPSGVGHNAKREAAVAAARAHASSTVRQRP